MSKHGKLWQPWASWVPVLRIFQCSQADMRSKSHIERCPACRGTSIANWTVGLSTGFQWIASLAATCTDGTALSSVVLGWNGSDARCNASLSQKITVNVTNSAGSFSFRSVLNCPQRYLHSLPSYCISPSTEIWCKKLVLGQHRSACILSPFVNQQARI